MAIFDYSVSRRRVLQIGASGAGLLAFGWPFRGVVQAAGNPHFLVTFIGDGGWDVTQVLDVHDPLDATDHIDVDVPQAISGLPPSMIATAGGITYVSNPATRPGVDTYFQNWGPRSVVVNGINTRSTSHDQSRQLVLTGYLDPTRADFAVMAANANGESLPVPHLLLSGASFGGAYAGLSARVGGQLSDALAYDHIPNHTDPNSSDQLGVSALGEAFIQQALAREGKFAIPAALADKTSLFTDAEQRGDRLAALASSLPQNSNDGAQLAMQLGRAFRSGMTTSVTISNVGGFDTHSDNTGQNGSWDAVFTFLDAFVGGLAGQAGVVSASLLDETTIVYCSEFARTPELNGNNGKDHHPWTSMLMVGKGVRGGTTVGMTDGNQEGVKTNFATGMPDDVTGLVIDVTNVVAGILTLVGANSNDYLPSVKPFTGMIA